MARPQTDIEAGRKMLLEVVEDMVRKRGATDISLTELASLAGMSPSNIYRFFENKEALFEALAENWFADKTVIMENVVASDLPPRDKMYEFFARRFVLMSKRHAEEPDLFKSHCALGLEHFEVVRGYIDLGDHYLSVIVAEAMEDGHFANMSIDNTVSLINQMVQCYCRPDIMITMPHRLSVEKLGMIIDAIFVGLGKALPAQLRMDNTPNIRIVT